MGRQGSSFWVSVPDLEVRIRGWDYLRRGLLMSVLDYSFVMYIRVRNNSVNIGKMYFENT